MPRIIFFFKDDSRWKIKSENPFEGSQHLRCTSSNSIGADLNSSDMQTDIGNVSVVDMMVDIKPGVTWRIIAKPFDFGSIGDGLIINPNGSLSVQGGVGSDKSIPYALPSDYFNLRIRLIKSTQEFSIAINGNVVYTGISLVSEYSQVSFVAGAEVMGATMDIDNIRFINDDDKVKLVSFVPSSGSVPPLGSQYIDVVLNTRSIDAGTYHRTFSVHSNDSVTADTSIPTTIVVKENALPVLTDISDTTIVSGETLSLTYSATDVDDSEVSVFGFNIYGGSTNTQEVTASGNGFVTYTFTTYEATSDVPYFGMIKAIDSRGGITSKIFEINVLARGYNDFALTNFKTGNDITSFTDTVEVDIAHADIDKLTIQLKTSEDHSPTPAGVRFILDGVETNFDRSAPYYIDSWQIPKLSEGDHTLTALVISGIPGESNVIATRRAVLHVINSAAVTSYHVVNRNGVKLMDLTEGSTIDLSRTSLNGINIIATTSNNTIRSVKFTLNNITARIDNGVPYALAGNPITGDTFWKPTPGYYTLSATPHMKYFAWGPKGKSLTIHFQVINGATPDAAIARTANSKDKKQLQLEGGLENENILSVYPVPVTDELNIELHESVKGNVVVKVINANGKTVHSKAGGADEFRKYSISTVQLGMNSGIYFVMVTQANGKRVAKKFIKE